MNYFLTGVPMALMLALFGSGTGLHPQTISTQTPASAANDNSANTQTAMTKNLFILGSKFMTASEVRSQRADEQHPACKSEARSALSGRFAAREIKEDQTGSQGQQKGEFRFTAHTGILNPEKKCLQQNSAEWGKLATPAEQTGLAILQAPELPLPAPPFDEIKQKGKQSGVLQFDLLLVARTG